MEAVSHARPGPSAPDDARLQERASDLEELTSHVEVGKARGKVVITI